MSAPLANPHARPLTRDTLNHVYVDRYPTMTDLTHSGGVPGIRYALVSVQRVAHYQSLGWDLVARLPVITIEITKGDRAGTYGAMLVCSGRPIPGVSAEASLRKYGVDPVLDEITGLGPAKPAQPPKPQSPPARKE